MDIRSWLSELLRTGARFVRFGIPRAGFQISEGTAVRGWNTGLWGATGGKSYIIWSVIKERAGSDRVAK